MLLFSLSSFNCSLAWSLYVFHSPHIFFYQTKPKIKREQQDTLFPITSTEQTRTNGWWEENRKWGKKPSLRSRIIWKVCSFFTAIACLLQPNHLYLLECMYCYHGTPCSIPRLFLHSSSAICAPFVTSWNNANKNENENEIEPNINMNDRKRRKKKIHSQTNLKVRFSRLLYVHACSPSCLLFSSHYSTVIPWRSDGGGGDGGGTLFNALPYRNIIVETMVVDVKMSFFNCLVFLSSLSTFLTLCERNETKPSEKEQICWSCWCCRCLFARFCGYFHFSLNCSF